MENKWNVIILEEIEYQSNTQKTQRYREFYVRHLSYISNVTMKPYSPYSAVVKDMIMTNSSVVPAPN